MTEPFFYGILPASGRRKTMVSKVSKKIAGLAALLLMGVLVSPVAAGLIFEESPDIRSWMFNSPPAEYGWAGVYEDGDGRLLRSAGDVATVLGLIWLGQWLWGNDHTPTIDPPVDPPAGGGNGDDPIVPEASTLALVGMGVIVLLALRRRQK